jgi:AraC-like DNA-binding protein
LKIRVKNKAEVSALFDRCFTEEELGQAAAVLSLTAYYLRASNAKNKEAGTDGTDKAIAYLKERYAEEFSLKQLASLANYSPNHLIRRFKEKTGMTPVSYLHALRIEEAKRLLTQTNKSVSEIMERVGFLDSAYFSKTFKRLVGYSPKRYREMEK